MAPKLIHVIGIHPGEISAWVRLTIPAQSIFGDGQPEIIEWDYGEFTGSEPGQAIAIARLARETQSLDYKVGPALICEEWDTGPETISSIRIGAMLSLLKHQGQLGDATLSFQGRAPVFSTMTDEQLKAKGLWAKESEDIRAATRHAIAGLRRARENPSFAYYLWPYLSDRAAL